MRYRTRVREVVAVQWTAKNLDEVRAICPGAFTKDCGWTLCLPIPEARRVVGMPDHLVAHVGDYVCRRPDDAMCLPMNADAFERNYEAA